jgi:hypothetical protein
MALAKKWLKSKRWNNSDLSDKPVFTLVFGIAGASAKIVSEARMNVAHVAAASGMMSRAVIPTGALYKRYP